MNLLERLLNEPAVPSAESVGNGQVGSCRDNVPPIIEAENVREDVLLTDTKIRRHVKIPRQADPFDPQWRPYSAERALRKKFGVMRQTVKRTPS